MRPNWKPCHFRKIFFRVLYLPLEHLDYNNFGNCSFSIIDSQVVYRNLCVIWSLKLPWKNCPLTVVGHLHKLIVHVVQFALMEVLWISREWFGVSTSFDMSGTTSLFIPKLCWWRCFIATSCCSWIPVSQRRKCSVVVAPWRLRAASLRYPPQHRLPHLPVGHRQYQRWLHRVTSNTDKGNPCWTNYQSRSLIPSIDQESHLQSESFKTWMNQLND